MKIRNKLLLLILSTVFVITACMIYLSYTTSHKVLVREIETRASFMLDKYRLQLNTKLEDVTQAATYEALAMQGLSVGLTRGEVNSLVQSIVNSSPDIYGSTAAFAPGKFGDGGELFAPYYHRLKDGTGVGFVDLAAESYNYPKWDWFRIPASTGRPYWTHPYIDKGGGDVAMVTYAYPFYKDGELWGVSTIDVSLGRLTKIVDGIISGGGGLAFLIDQNGTFLSMKRPDSELKRSIFDIAREMNSPLLDSLGKEMIDGKNGLVSIMNPLIGKQSWFVYGPVPATGWSLAIVLPEDELLADMRTLHRNNILIGMGGLIFLFVLIFIISSRISGPITSLALAAQRIASGDLGSQIKVKKTGGEVGLLAGTFEKMRASLSGSLKQLKDDKEMFAIAFSQMSDGLVILDVNCNVVEFNRSAEKYLMLPAKGSFKEHLALHFEGEMPFLQSNDCLDKDATFKIARRNASELGALHLECSARVIRDDEGGVREHVLSVRNITELETEERSKRDFLSLMSHKLFTPLTVLQGKLMILKDGLAGNLEEKQSKLVTSMVDQTAKLNNLIGSLVSFVSLDEEHLDTSREEIDLKGVINQAAEECRSWFSEKNPVIEIRVADDLTKLNFNQKYLSMIVKHLIDNALKFNMSGQAKVVIDCKHAGANAVISIADNGIGIPPEFLDRIFDKFYQIEKYYTGNVEGVGLGLAYVKKIVETFGGSVSVNSEVGKGSVFTLKIPLG